MKGSAALLSFLLIAGCGCSRSKATPTVNGQHDQAARTDIPVSSAQTRVEMANVRIHLDPRLVLQIRRLSGTLVPTAKGVVPSFDDKLSYVIEVDSAEIRVDTATMAYVMNTYVFGERGAPIKDLKLSVKGGEIKQEGVLKKGIGIPFEVVGGIGPTTDGKVRIHAREMKAAHLPVKGLMKIFGVDMAELINTKHARGMRIDDNDIILDAAEALPPPKIRGKITAVWVEGDQIVQQFGSPRRETAAKEPASNYMAYRGGILRFGKLTMNDTDLRMIDSNPADPFDFWPEHYKDHLVAGYSKTTASGGLLVYMPDYSKITKEKK